MTIRAGRALAASIMLAVALAPLPGAQGPAPAAHGPLDELLDLYVRDGYVYYRALRSDRGRLDRYVAALGTAAADGMARDQQIAFWLNAYNAIVLETVVDHYPIRRRSGEYPAGSIRQIPGAFERLRHRVGGRAITLDEIETGVLASFGDPRVHLALGRGAVGGGRLRSEAFVPSMLEEQLAEVARECAARVQCVHIDRTTNQLMASALFSWREREFVAAYAEKSPATFAARSPIERALVALVEPNLLTIERDFLAKNAFEVRYLPFDWTLNDLTGRGGR